MRCEKADGRDERKIEKEKERGRSTRRNGETGRRKNIERGGARGETEMNGRGERESGKLIRNPRLRYTEYGHLANDGYLE